MCTKTVYIVLFVVHFFITTFLCLYVLTLEDCHCPNGSLYHNAEKKVAISNEVKIQSKLQPNEKVGHKLAVLVPFRDRFNELLQFGPYMTNFLKYQSINHEIYVLNQIDNFRFNRASLINVGFKYAKADCDYVVMHDVDLLPLNNKLLYAYPETGVFHISSPELHPRYDYPTFVGGILIIKRDDFEKVNGMSNKYWGWGLEDDEFYIRLKDAKIKVSRPQNITTGKSNTFRHFHDRSIRKRDMQKCFNQKEVTRRRDHLTGLHDVAYKIQSIQKMTIDSTPVTIINIQLLCDRNVTPWCICEPIIGTNTLLMLSFQKELNRSSMISALKNHQSEQTWCQLNPYKEENLGSLPRIPNFTSKLKK